MLITRAYGADPLTPILAASPFRPPYILKEHVGKDKNGACADEDNNRQRAKNAARD